MNKKILLLMIGMFLIFTIISAAEIAEPDYIAEYYTDVDIIEACVVSGFPCDNSYGCNITITNPDDVVVVRDNQMDRNFPTYNYTFTNTSVLGDYKIKVYCTNGTNSGYDESIILQVTTTGSAPEIKVPIFMLLISLVVFILALYLKNHAVGFISGVLITLTGIYLMAYGFGDIANLYTQAMAYVVLAFGLFVVLIAGIEWLDENG